MSQKIRKEYTDQQKAEAVEIVVSTKQSVRQVARNLGIAESSLSRWVRESQGKTAAKSPGALGRDERQELVQLRRQVKQLEMERDFLKKAAAFFAREVS
jgi:transposase